MELSSEERKRIYEEEKARIEDEKAPQKEKRRAATDSPESSMSTRTQRLTSSGITIAWNIALLVILYVCKQYMAYYQIEQVNGSAKWVKYEILTADFNTWLLVLTVALSLSIIGHIIAMIFDKYIIRQSVNVIGDILAIGVIAYLLILFPFDFSPIPQDGPLVITAILKISLVIALIFMAVVTLMHLVKLIVRVVTKTAVYRAGS